MRQLSPEQVAVVTSLPTPTTALAGSILRLSSDNKPYWCTGSAWVDMTLAGSAIAVSATAPSSPSVNDLWLDIS